MAIALLIVDLIVLIPRMVYSLNSGNATEIVAYTTENVSFFLSTVSLFISFVAMVTTYNSLEITNETLEITKTEQNIRDIENSLAYFYNPLQDFIFFLQIQQVVWTKEQLEIGLKIGGYRYLADDDTRNKFYDDLYTPLIIHEHLPSKEKLSKLQSCVIHDIAIKEQQINELKNSLKKHLIESPGAKKPRYKFW